MLGSGTSVHLNVRHGEFGGGEGDGSGRYGGTSGRGVGVEGAGVLVVGCGAGLFKGTGRVCRAAPGGVNDGDTGRFFLAESGGVEALGDGKAPAAGVVTAGVGNEGEGDAGGDPEG